MSSDGSSAEPDPFPNPESPKRSAGAAGLNVNANGRPVKRRASKACQCCRARKVRCNVVEHGAPCTNCRLDEVPCVVTESKRRKKHNNYSQKPLLDSIVETPHLSHLGPSGADAIANGNVNPMDVSNPAFRRSSESGSSMNDADEDSNIRPHVPHSLYQNQTRRLSGLDGRKDVFYHASPAANLLNVNGLLGTVSIHGDLTSVATRLQSTAASPPSPSSQGILPGYIKPLPQRINSDDIHFLWKKGALSIPDTIFRNELIRCYIEFVHPYMPLIDLHEFLTIINEQNGENGKISFVLFQAVMFAGTAFIDMSYLAAAGHASRKAARKVFYQKARLLYDFDYEIDRLALVQSLMLMTYWYETPDDQKDTWHWMGVAISLAHTIGLHRNPAKSTMDIRKQRLWKRIWWSCFMRDRLVALGMRRPTRIKDEDYDVPMLTVEDFEIEVLPIDNFVISTNCPLMRDTDMQTELANLCIAKAKLCLCISHVLSAQYSVLVRDQGVGQSREGNTLSTVMLFPKKLNQTEEVKLCDTELTEWIENLPAAYRYRTPASEDVPGRKSLIVQRSLLHMVYHASVSALHRPQVLPSAEAAELQKCRDLQDLSRKKVRDASKEITRISLDLHNLQLERYLPTSGVTVLLPAIIIHLLDIKSFSETTRAEALQGFCHCMLVLEKLRDIYASADFATLFLEAAIRKADIDVAVDSSSEKNGVFSSDEGASFKTHTGKKIAQNVSQIIDAGRAARFTPPPDKGINSRTAFAISADINGSPSEIFTSAITPPNSDSSSHPRPHQIPAFDPNKMMNLEHSSEFDEGFDALINFDVDEDWECTLEEGIHGESGGFMMDIDWMKEASDSLQWPAMSPNLPGGPESMLQPEEAALFMLQDDM